MKDKVVNIIRETLLHENEVEKLSFDFEQDIALLEIRQPGDQTEYPYNQLELTFQGVRELHLSSTPAEIKGADLLNIECARVADQYKAKVLVGRVGSLPIWTMQLTFSDLVYKRYKVIP